MGLGLPPAGAHAYLPQPKPARAFGDRVSFETGVSYLSGLVGGGLYGAGNGVYAARKQGFTGKLFVNQVRPSDPAALYGPHIRSRSISQTADAHCGCTLRR